MMQTAMTDTPNLNSTPRTIIALLFLLGFIFFFMGLGGYDLAAPDEPRFGLVAQEMLADHHWVLPHRNENPYPDKPPFFFWCIAFFSFITGGTVTAWTARMPSAVAAALVLWIMWRWSRNQREADGSDWRSLLTVLILMSCSKFFFQARIAQIDMVLCLFTTAAMTTGYHAMTRQPFSAFWLGVFMGIGILTKGPVGYLVPAGAMAVYAAFSGRDGWRAYPLKSLAWGFLPVIIWLGLLLIDVAMNNQWDYLNNLLFKQTVVRYFDAWHHHQPVYYFLVSILYDFLPWTPFFLLAIPFGKKAWQKLDSRQKYAWSVILFTLVFFSLSRGKRSIYILPVFPFAAYVTAARIEALMQKKWLTAWERSAGLVAGLLLLFVGIALLVMAAGWIEPPLDWIDAPIPGTSIGLAGAGLTAAAIYIIFSVIKIRIKSMTAGIVAAMVVINLLMYAVILPWLDPFRSARGFAEKMNQIIARETGSENSIPVLGMVDYRSAYRLYGQYPIVELATESGRPRPDLPRISDFFETYPDGWLIVRERDWNHFMKDHPFEAVIHIEQKVGSGKNFMLITKEKTKS